MDVQVSCIALFLGLGLTVHMGQFPFDSNYSEIFSPIVAELGAKITADGNLG